VAGSNNWPIVTDADGYLRGQEKRLLRQERRPMVKQASDILGPGIAPYAVQISHWNTDEATFNGVFWTEPGDTGAPDLTHWWIGQTEASSDGFGIQQVLSFRESGTWPPLTYRRQFYDPGNGNITYSQWVSQHHIAVGDSVSSAGSTDAPGPGNYGPWSFNGDGTISTPGFYGDTLPIMRRSRSANQNVADDLDWHSMGNWDDIITDSGNWTYGGSEFTLVGPEGVWLCSATIKADAGSVEYVARGKWRRNNSVDLIYGSTIKRDAGSDTYIQVQGAARVTAGQIMEVQMLINRASGASTTTLSGTDSQLSFTYMGA